nr:hypothetical protein [Tanacetum cinerariifolium]
MEKVVAVQCAFQIKGMPWCSRFCAKILFAASENYLEPTVDPRILPALLTNLTGKKLSYQVPYKKSSGAVVQLANKEDAKISFGFCAKILFAASEVTYKKSSGAVVQLANKEDAKIYFG